MYVKRSNHDEDNRAGTLRSWRTTSSSSNSMSASIVIIDCNKSGVSILSYSALVSGCRGSNAEEVDGGGVLEIFHSALVSGCRNDGTEEVNGDGVPVVSHPALVSGHRDSGTEEVNDDGRPGVQVNGFTNMSASRCMAGLSSMSCMTTSLSRIQGWRPNCSWSPPTDTSISSDFTTTDRAESACWDSTTPKVSPITYSSRQGSFQWPRDEFLSKRQFHTWAFESMRPTWEEPKQLWMNVGDSGVMAIDWDAADMHATFQWSTWSCPRAFIVMMPDVWPAAAHSSQHVSVQCGYHPLWYQSWSLLNTLFECGPTEFHGPTQHDSISMLHQQNLSTWCHDHTFLDAWLHTEQCESQLEYVPWRACFCSLHNQ